MSCKCFYCGAYVIWGGDHDFEDYGYEGDGIVSNLHCSKCDVEYITLTKIGDEDDRDRNLKKA